MTIYFDFACFSGGIARYSNDYFSGFSFEIKSVGVTDLKQKNIQTGEDKSTREYISVGLNMPCTITLTVQCYTQKMGELAKSYMDSINKYDTGGTLELIDINGTSWIFIKSILSRNPLEKTVDVTDDVANYELIFKAPQPESPSTL